MPLSVNFRFIGQRLKNKNLRLYLYALLRRLNVDEEDSYVSHCIFIYGKCRTGTTLGQFIAILISKSHYKNNGKACYSTPRSRNQCDT